jgi:hypothetical protein
MTGISEIANGDNESVVFQNGSGQTANVVVFEDLCEWDQMMMAIWEMDEPPIALVSLDPAVNKAIKSRAAGQ